MFTGIITSVGIIKEWNKNSGRIGIECSYDNLKLGESISCSGVCLTVSEFKDNIFYCNLSPETVSKTNLKKKMVKEKVNLERSLRLGDDLGGHLVFGHVDGISILEKISKNENSWVLGFSLNRNLIKYLAVKCSIAIDGISLTVNEVFENSFNVSIVPFTWDNTNLKSSKIGTSFNIEIDMLSRYVFRALNK